MQETLDLIFDAFSCSSSLIFYSCFVYVSLLLIINIFLRCEFNGRRCLIDPAHICNGSVSCLGLDPCDVRCPEFYRCQNGECANRTTICDRNCFDRCLEDDGWKTGVGFQCIRSGELCRLPQQLLQDDVQDCDQGDDLCFDWAEQATIGLVRTARYNSLQSNR